MYECLFWDCEHRDVAQDAELCLMHKMSQKPLWRRTWVSLRKQCFLFFFFFCMKLIEVLVVGRSFKSFMFVHLNCVVSI